MRKLFESIQMCISKQDSWALSLRVGDFQFVLFFLRQLMLKQMKIYQKR